MLRLLLSCLLQCVVVTLGQILLKVGLARMGDFSFTWSFLQRQLSNWALLSSGIVTGVGIVMWMWILKKYDFSIAYPLTSISYVLGIGLAVMLLHESVPLTRWLGVLLITAGCILTVK